MKLTKRFLTWAVILSLVLVLLPFSLASATNVTVRIDAPDEVDAGSDFVARVNISEVTGLDSFQFRTSYDPSVIEVSDVIDGLIGW